MQLVHYANRLRDRLLPSAPSVAGEVGEPSSRPAVLFVVTIVFYAAYMLCTQSPFALRGEMWAEMATNYFANANGHTLAQRLLSTDAGYIPLPQRLFAFACAGLRLPAAAIPFAYTWFAIIASASMVGVFCLRPFRVLIKSDGLRLLTAFAVLGVVDFETRTFINFTYFAAFFAAVVTALALADTTRDVPRWAWLLPLLMLSKPAVLASFPVMAVTAIISASRFRRIVIVVILLAIAQALQIAVSHSHGTFATARSVGILDLLLAAVKYFVGFLGAFSAGSLYPPGHYHPLWGGLVVVALLFWLIWRRRVPSNALLIVGMSLLAFNVLLDCYALPDSWNADMQRLLGTPTFRHIIVGFHGVVLIMVALCDRLTFRRSMKSNGFEVPLSVLLFSLWIGGAGWFDRGTQMINPPAAPLLNNSSWEGMADAIDAGGPVCVPVNPVGWMYGKGCKLLNADQLGLAHTYDFAPMPHDGYASAAEIPVLHKPGRLLLALGVLIRSNRDQEVNLKANAVVTLTDGTTRVLSGGRKLLFGGGLVLLTGDEKIALDRIQSVRFMVDSPVQLGVVTDSADRHPAVLWMGR